MPAVSREKTARLSQALAARLFLENLCTAKFCLTFASHSAKISLREWNSCLIIKNSNKIKIVNSNETVKLLHVNI